MILGLVLPDRLPCHFSSTCYCLLLTGLKLPGPPPLPHNHPETSRTCPRPRSQVVRKWRGTKVPADRILPVPSHGPHQPASTSRPTKYGVHPIHMRRSRGSTGLSAQQALHLVHLDPKRYVLQIREKQAVRAPSCQPASQPLATPSRTGLVWPAILSRFLSPLPTPRPTTKNLSADSTLTTKRNCPCFAATRTDWLAEHPAEPHQSSFRPRAPSFSSPAQPLRDQSAFGSCASAGLGW